MRNIIPSRKVSSCGATSGYDFFVFNELATAPSGVQIGNVGGQIVLKPSAPQVPLPSNDSIWLKSQYFKRCLSRLSQYAWNPNAFPPATSQQFEETKPIWSRWMPRCFSANS